MEWNKFGTSFFMADTPPEDVFAPLPPAVYSVKVTPFGGYFLSKLFNNFDLPSKFYGDVHSKTERVIGSYDQRSTSTGVLFVGEKGSGKSLTAKHICNEMLAKNVPIIVINNPYNNNGFCEFIKKIDQDCVIFIDEFEKLYRAEDNGSDSLSSDGTEGTDGASSQDKLLSLFDGVFSSKKLFILTANNKYNISSFLLNRPGRIYYMFEYTGLTQDFIEEYCQDNLLNKSYINKTLAITSMFSTFTFDMIQGLVEEMNRFDLPPDEAIEGMNIKKPDHREMTSFSAVLSNANGDEVLYNYDVYRDYKRESTSIEVDVTINDILIFKETSKSSDVVGSDIKSNKNKKSNLLIDTGRLHTETSINEYTYGNGAFELFTYFLSTDLKQVDGKKGVYIYINKDGFTLKLTKINVLQEFGFNFSAY